MKFDDIIKFIDSSAELKKYNQNKLMLWALQIKYQIEDIDLFASSYLTDDGDDKKCDLIWVNRDEGFAIIAQDYFSLKARKSAPSNKASDLNTAVAWVLGDVNLSEIPESIRFGVKDVREALENKEINQVFFYYIHNLPESTNVSNELSQVKQTAERYIDDLDVNVFTKEVGQKTIIEWYENLQNPILVTDIIELSYENGFSYSGEKWRSFLTNISGIQLKNWYIKYGQKLFSANQRDYLASRNSDKNINNGIKLTARDNPGNFWVFNNGISVITNCIEVEKEKKKITVTGISIINGAQTTGSIGSVEGELDSTLMVSCRFIECSDQEIIREIVRYNNLQNKLIPSDFRSTDRIQKKLVEDFEAYEGEELIYTGGRRGGATDVIKRRSNLVPSDTVAQVLTAFHGRPDIGYKFKSRIWEENEDYKRVFNDKTSVEHIIFVYSLFLEIINIRSQLKKKSKEGNELTSQEQFQLDFFNARGSVFVLVYALSKTMENFIDKKINDKFDLQFKESNTLDVFRSYWRPIIDIALSFSEQLLEGLQDYTLTMDIVENALSNFNSFIKAVVVPNRERIEIFAKEVK